jgi:hypothetical protein
LGKNFVVSEIDPALASEQTIASFRVRFAKLGEFTTKKILDVF